MKRPKPTVFEELATVTERLEELIAVSERVLRGVEEDHHTHVALPTQVRLEKAIEAAKAALKDSK